MTEYQFVVVHDKNQFMCPEIFSSEQCTNLKGECIVMGKIKGQVH